MEKPDRMALLGVLDGRRRGVLTTRRKNGRPQMSTVSFAYYPEQLELRISATADRAKVINLRRDPVASFHVATADDMSYIVMDGAAEVTPTAAEPSDPTVEALVALFRDIQGEHSDWTEYREAMVAEKRVVITVAIDHVYGYVRPS